MFDTTAASSATPVSNAALYDSGGDKPVLLLLHGIGGTWSIWAPVIARLEARFRIIAPTLPGHHGGPAYAGQGPATVAGLAEQLIAMLQARGITTAHVAGNSLGGWLSMELARRGFARSVVALSPAGGWSTPADYQAIAREFRIVHALLPILLVLTWFFIGIAACRRALGRKTMEHAERMTAPDFRASLQAMRKTVVLPQLLDTMGRDGPIKPFTPVMPVIIAWGGADQVIPFQRYGRPYLERIAGARSTTLAGVGHVPMYDDPDAVAATIIEGCREAPAAS
ncbi:MAG: alpha/beta hydrolase [Pseudomonadota bacterium]